NDFSSPVTYTVTAEDGSTQDYSVTVIVAEMHVGYSAEETITGLSESLTMVYAQDQVVIHFPMKIDDSQTATVTTRFWIAQTEFTNTQAKAILQWAYTNGRFSDTVGDHDGLDTTTAKHGDKELLDLGNSRINYDGAGTFYVQYGYEDHPANYITWYGAVMLCNWLTEMRDGTTENLVYSGITPNWNHGDTEEDPFKNGYRLPSSDECEYSARYLGTTAPSTGGDLDTERKYGNDNDDWTDGYYWTPGNYASGAEADYHYSEACRAVAVYDEQDPVPTTTEPVKSLGTAGANELGLYDMSGNVYEWCFTANGTLRNYHGGSWISPAYELQVGNRNGIGPHTALDFTGFRLCRTAD
ncbi:MAG: formylglycine-generating enzyme family protein, partial [Bacteroidales bacterium]